MIPDPIAPARGCAWGSCLGCLAWVAIFTVIAVIVSRFG